MSTIIRNTWPDAKVVIDAPGVYMTQEGLEVVIYEIKETGATFNCHGHLLIPSKLGRARTKREWNIWSPEGHFMAIEKHKNDIVRRVS